MSFWRKLFGVAGGGEAAAQPEAASAEETYKGFTIRAAIMPAGSEFQLAGSIEKEIDGVVKRHDFVRADRFGSKVDAATYTLVKARQIVDEQGDRVFR